MLPLWAFIVFYSYGIPLFLVYSLILYVLISKRKIFHSQFYRIIVIFGFNDLLEYLNAQFILRGPLCTFLYDRIFSGIENGVTWYPIFFLFLRVSLELVAYFGTAVLAWNRVTSFLFPTRHNQLWEQFLIPTTTIIYAIPCLLYGYILLNRAVLLCGKEKNEITACFVNYDHSVGFLGLSVGSVDKVAYVILPVLAGSLNTTALFLLYLRKRSLKSTKQWRREIRFTICSTMTFLSHLSLGINAQFVTITVDVDQATNAAYVLGILLPCIYDFSMLVTVASLLLPSKALRAELRALFKLSMPYGREHGSSVTKTQPINEEHFIRRWSRKMSVLFS
ncbi:unnamed protein product [Bursaphelenchus xylophilus]|uniref:Serpentine receptor class gamma n=1 Tax=Bursaphelenchus xylophilus TaxID=6326 RepID=A0A1I7SBN0_BURXY|nr:unnamed protein product [Bursaphelenchus xylophilus]CAG9114497.1 unnamed protein product [Bursaphelenchus xylophilus]